MNMNPPQPNTPVRNTKLFFPRAFVFSQRCFALSDGGFSREQYQRHKLIGDIFNQAVEGFKPTEENSGYTSELEENCSYPPARRKLRLLNEGIGCDKGHRGHTRLDPGVLASQNCLCTLEGFAAEQRYMFAGYFD